VPLPLEGTLETVVESALPAAYVADGIEANGDFPYEEGDANAALASKPWWVYFGDSGWLWRGTFIRVLPAFPCKL
jgi:hypothetical protein